MGGLSIITPTSIANTSGTATASGGLITFTGVTALSLNGVFTSTYNQYRILVEMSSASNATITGRLRLAGTDNSAANSYIVQELNAASTSVTGVRTTSTQWSIWFYCYANTRNNVSIDMFSPAIAKETTFNAYNFYTTSQAGIALTAGVHNVTTAFDGVSFISTQAITGTLSVYGYKKS